MQKQKLGYSLVCTYKTCTRQQTEDGEFCEKHFPKKKCMIIECKNKVDNSRGIARKYCAKHLK